MAEPDYIGPKKICTSCRVEKPATITFFAANKGGKLGLRGQCAICRGASERQRIARPEVREKRNQYQSEYVASGRNAIRNRRWREANRKSCSASQRKWVAKNREHVRAQQQEWRNKNREKVRAKQRRTDARLQRSPEHVLKKRIKARLRQMLKGKSLGSTEKLLGYSGAELKRHIERQFSRDMSWEKLMLGDIHIDHIIPVSKFKITSIASPDFSACWALTNLRPMWAKDNQQKQARVLHLL